MLLRLGLALKAVPLAVSPALSPARGAGADGTGKAHNRSSRFSGRCTITDPRRSRIAQGAELYYNVHWPSDAESGILLQTYSPYLHTFAERLCGSITRPAPWLCSLNRLPVWRPMTLDEFFNGRPASRRIFNALSDALAEVGPAEIRVTRSQVAFRRKRAFAWAWIPGRYLRGDHAPLVLTLAMRRKDQSPRWKQVVEPTKGRYTHHLELRSEEDVDDEVRTWIREAWSLAG